MHAVFFCHMNGVRCEVFQVIYKRDCTLLSLSVEMVLSELRRVSVICVVSPISMKEQIDLHYASTEKLCRQWANLMKKRHLKDDVGLYTTRSIQRTQTPPRL